MHDIVPVEVHPCNFEDIVVWQRKIHKPFIAPHKGIGWDWDWPAYFLGSHFSEQALGRQAIALQLRVPNERGEGVPVAQAILSLPYSWPGDPRQRCVFIWFLAATPLPALRALGIKQRFVVLPAILDTAVQVSCNHGLLGLIGLHAAKGVLKKESDDLFTRYKSLGLSARTTSKSFFRFPHRREDGRLFYLNATDALAFSAKQDDLR